MRVVQVAAYAPAMMVLLTWTTFCQATETPSVVCRTGVFDVREFGAKGDGRTLDTQAIQAAVDACHDAGGGRVSLAGGTFVSGTIVLKNGVHLRIEPGATLMGSPDLKDYPPKVCAFRSYADNYTDKSLIYAEQCEDVGLEGLGRIDGQGRRFNGPYKVRPYLVRMVECRQVTVRDVTFLDSPMWVQHYLACDQVRIDGITVRSQANRNNDGLDIDCCWNVRISGCDIRSGDDAIVLKSTADRSCRNVTISHCILSSDCNAFKCGTESNGGFENITVSNCAIYDTRLAGIALELVDGGRFERVNISNIVMNNVRGGLFVRLGHRARPFQSEGPKPSVGTMQGIHISNVQGDGIGPTGCSITGLPGHPVRDVLLRDIRLRFAGGGRVEEARHTPPEEAATYPEYTMFGTLPAYGLFIRHAEGVRLDALNVGFVEREDRPPIVCHDVKDLHVCDLAAATGPLAPAALSLRNVRDASIYATSRLLPGECFLRVDGAECAGIVFRSDGPKPGLNVSLGPDVSPGAIRLVVP